MYCPRCSQEQLSSEVKFCSRCGFLLTGISEVTANDGLIPQIYASKKEKKSLKRFLNVRSFLIAFQVLSLFLIILSGASDAPEEIVTFLFGLAFGVFVSLLASVFLANKPKFNASKSDESSAAELIENQANFALPPQASQPVSSYAPPAGSWKTFTTNDLAPHSVTDRTTKLLNKDE